MQNFFAIKKGKKTMKNVFKKKDVNRRKNTYTLRVHSISSDHLQRIQNGYCYDCFLSDSSKVNRSVYNFFFRSLIVFLFTYTQKKERNIERAANICNNIEL